MMNNPDAFINKIKNYDGENIPENVLEASNKIIQDPTKRFNEKDVLS